ncbi:SusC/RagA family TonB-linked outer membrane protein [Capnocytophaga stomatis]|uniref:SusC/RagA family TonB-linked outer membrane protein n=1 Tax=Capnocytophaga stomatis TaxID=1848904 RepID=A0A250FYV9_9FLAO|nr:TonB-dependent receptor [Capnocytophaga stomatis]ATA89268.1 SusC/RagA family protein [Capnocytophaga stomatis]GIJ96850.1 SusC/RagA family TonB-linked outer membrane protein [Capnocytophaga stomatis]
MKVLKKYVVSFVLLLGWIASLEAQNILQVTGTVSDDSGMPLPGVSVIVKGTTKGTSTDFNGKFELKDIPQGATLEFSFIGFKTIDVRVTGNTVNVKMQEETEELDEIVVIGYGTQKKGDVTTAITSVSTKDIDQRPVTSAAQAIQGRAAGVQVVQPSGAPGAGLSVRIRGNTSISASNDPLYVVDGVPVQDINNIAPTDIQDMQILKDASSSAIYGSRAANGVVLITTKQGKGGEAKVSINSYIGMSNIANKIESLNYAQYKELMDETKAATIPAGLTDVTDWNKETYRTGFNRNYQVSVSDANERTNYYLSAGYTKDDGIIRSSFFERYNVRLNLENKTKKWLTLGANVSYSDYSSNNIISGQGSNRAGVVLSVINTPTYAPIWSDNPKQYYNNFYGVNITHPVENISRNADNSTNNNRFVGSGSATIHFTDALKFKSTFAIDRLAHKHTSWLDPEATAWGRQNFGNASDVRSNVTLLTFDNLLTFDKNFGKHSLSLLAGTSGTTSKYDESEIRGSHYASSDIKTLNAANKIDPNSTKTYASQWAMMSYLGRISYNYDGKYLLTANFRADGSSKLAPGKRWGYFPSISVGWRLSKENFLSDVAWLSDLKIRGGWGQVGNQAGIGPYGHLLLYSIARKDWWDSNNTNALVTISPTSFSNPDLTWETTTQSNIGIDIALFNNRLALTADAYLKRTTDLLMNVPLPATSPYPFVYRNEGEMTNKGLEFGINSRNFVGEDFNWNTAFNISFNRNKLEKLTLQKVYYYARTSERTNEYVVRMQEGMPLGQFWGRISEGVNPDTGDIVYRDVNGDGNVDSNDKTFIGDPNPDFTFGLTNDFTYKNFSLNIFLQGSYGNDIYNASRIEMEGMYDGKNQSTAVLNRWRTPGQVTDIPRAVRGTNNIFASSRWVEDGSYLRVKSVTLSYNVPVQSLEKLGIRKIQPYFTAQNLLTFTNYKGFDPEVNQFTGNQPIFGIDWGTYPQTKTFIFGLNVEF